MEGDVEMWRCYSYRSLPYGDVRCHVNNPTVEGQYGGEGSSRVPPLERQYGGEQRSQHTATRPHIARQGHGTRQPGYVGHVLGM